MGRKSQIVRKAVAVAKAGPASKKPRIESPGNGNSNSEPPLGDAVVSKKSSKSTRTPLKPLISYLTDEVWTRELNQEFSTLQFKNVEGYLAKRFSEKATIYPPIESVFAAFNFTPLDSIKAVIIGQDPYHGKGQAHGLCFSVNRGVPIPPSLKNIYKELTTDITGFVAPNHGNLEEWAKRGVFLLNAALTVEEGKPNSHAKCGWEHFTDSVIKVISNYCTGVVFILWGNFAQKKGALVDASKHSVIKAAHPSPLSVTKFLNCRCFSLANEELKKRDKEPVDWTLPLE